MKPADLLAVMGASFSACEVARTVAWLGVQFHPETRTRAEVVAALQAYEDAVRHAREEFERAAPKAKP
jgi:GMP synthase-like glutamine amidotransferase